MTSPDPLRRLLQYRADGPEDAPPLVLGPALGSTWHMWDRQVPELARAHRVIRFDLPGHGGAPAEPAASVPELSARLLATLDHLGVTTFGYAGCSLGGALGLRLALDAPHRVGALALVSSAARFGTPDAWRQRGVVVRNNGLAVQARSTPERWFTAGFAALQPAIAEWAEHMVAGTDPGCYVAACEALAAFDVRADLAGVRVPTLVVAGAQDGVTPPADARALVAGIRDARLAMVPDAAHLVPVEAPAALGELLERHFASALTAAAPAAPTVPPAASSGVPRQTGAPPAEDAPGAESAADGAPTPYPDPYEAGMRVRREVLGDAHVDAAAARADDFSRDFQDHLTRTVWGQVWTRDGLDRRTRAVITLTALVARGHLDELAFHTRAALRTGLTPAEIRELLIHAGVYCGVPAANSAFAVAQRVITEETTPSPEDRTP